MLHRVYRLATVASPAGTATAAHGARRVRQSTRSRAVPGCRRPCDGSPSARQSMTGIHDRLHARLQARPRVDRRRRGKGAPLEVADAPLARIETVDVGPDALQTACGARALAVFDEPDRLGCPAAIVPPFDASPTPVDPPGEARFEHDDPLYVPELRDPPHRLPRPGAALRAHRLGVAGGAAASRLVPSAAPSARRRRDGAGGRRGCSQAVRPRPVRPSRRRLSGMTS